MTNEPFKTPSDLNGLSREELEIRLRQCLNDLRLTKKEARENALKYMEMVGELGDRNVELQALKDGLEDALSARNAELLLAEEGDNSANWLKETLESVADGLREAASVRGVKLTIEGGDLCKLPLEGERSLPLVLETLCEGLLRCCHSGAELTLKSCSSAESSLCLDVFLSTESVDEALLEETLKSCDAPADWRGLSGLLSLLTGWTLSQDAKGRGFLLCIPGR